LVRLRRTGPVVEKINMSGFEVARSDIVLRDWGMTAPRIIGVARRVE
jgi:hypothetical protein